eukprot:SAG31_NODE_711_length_12665_cov_2.283225_6_plen_44_part_00
MGQRVDDRSPASYSDAQEDGRESGHEDQHQDLEDLFDKSKAAS